MYHAPYADMSEVDGVAAFMLSVPKRGMLFPRTPERGYVLSYHTTHGPSRMTGGGGLISRMPCMAVVV